MVGSDWEILRAILQRERPDRFQLVFDVGKNTDRTLVELVNTPGQSRAQYIEIHSVKKDITKHSST